MTNRGAFYVPEPLKAHAASRGVDATPAPPAGRGPVVVASYGDLLPLIPSKRYLVLFEHGAGFSFSKAHPSYAGGARHRALVSLFVCPNEYAADRNRERFPEAAVAVVGCPKLDRWHLDPPRPKNRKPVIAVAWHWDCKVAPEARWAYPVFARSMREVAARYTLLATAHSRCPESVRTEMEACGAQWVEDFDEVMERADLLINDASSVLYEFASTDRPVVVLNAPWYRRKVNHGLRFWEHADVGINCDDPAALLDCIDAALADPPEQREKRAAATDAAYSFHDGSAARRAADLLDDMPRALRRRGCELPPMKPSPLAVKKAAGMATLAPGGDAPASFALYHDAPTVVLGKLSDLAPPPFDLTAFIAPGLRLRAPLDSVFAALSQGWELVALHDARGSLAPTSRGPAPDAARVREVWATEDVIALDPAFFAVRKTAASTRFLAAWVAEGGDAIGFARALRTNPVKVWWLASTWKPLHLEG